MEYKNSYHQGSLADKKILITGGAGFIGSHVAEYLLQHGAGEVRVIDNLLTGLGKNIDYLRQYPNFVFINADINEPQAIAEACEGVQAICHQAALGSVPRSVLNPAATFRNNVEGLASVAAAARDKGVKRIVFASSSSVYGDKAGLKSSELIQGRPLSPYALSKQTNETQAELFQKLYGIDYAGFRYFNVFGPRQSPKGIYAAVIPLFMDALAQGKEVFINGDGLQSRDFTFVENVVQANVKAMFASNKKALNKIYNIGCGGNYTILELFQSLAERMGAAQASPVFREARAGDIFFSRADISRAKSLLKYNPLFDFYQGLDITVDYFQRFGAWL